MKLLLSLFIFVGSVTASARQYTQCSSNSPELYSVINLSQKKEGTLYLTLGAETNDRSLSHIVLKEETADKMIYDVYGKTFQGILEVPSNLMGLNSDYIEVKFTESDATYNFTCFTRNHAG